MLLEPELDESGGRTRPPGPHGGRRGHRARPLPRGSWSPTCRAPRARSSTCSTCGSASRRPAARWWRWRSRSTPPPPREAHAHSAAPRSPNTSSTSTASASRSFAERPPPPAFGSVARPARLPTRPQDPQARPGFRRQEVRSAFRRRAGGASLSKLARELGVTNSGLRAILRNRVYLGELRVGAHVNTSAHPPPSSEDEWLAVQSMTTARLPRRSHSEEVLALLAWALVRCASCSHMTSPGTRPAPHYPCHRQHSAGPCPRPAAITGLVHTRTPYVERIAFLRARPSLKASRASETTVGSRGYAGTKLRAAELGARRGSTSRVCQLRPGAPRPVRGRARASAGTSWIGWRDRLMPRLLARVAPSGRRRPGRGVEDALDNRQRNQLLRGLLECVLVAPPGAASGSRSATACASSPMALGPASQPYPGGGVPRPISASLSPTRDDPVVPRRMELREDSL